MAPSVGNHRLSLAILAAGLVSVGPVVIVAQTSTAVCLSSFDWMSNSKGQNPCVVSAYLQGACYGGQFTIIPLSTSQHYIGPNANQSNQCQCSSVTYNTISACGLCQNGTIISWSVWDTNCTTIYPGVFVPGVPAGTAVPQWAFQDVITSDLFNVTLAQSVGDSPESTALNNAKSTGSVNLVSTVASALLTASPSPTVGTGTASSGSSSSTAAIVGGVVGGIVGLALITATALLVMKKRSQTPPSAHFTAPASPASPSGVYPDITRFVPQMAQPRLYDPSDPSTFPASPPLTTIQTGTAHGTKSYVDYSNSSLRPSGSYTGLPTI